MRSCLIVLALAGCLEPRSIVTCGDLLCPIDTTCMIVAGSSSCYNVRFVDACTGRTDGDDCRVEGAGAFDGLCRAGICTIPSCGDGIARDPEQCEGEELRGATCEDLGHYGGTLGCTPACTFDRSQCAGSCGNGVLDDGEPCEGVDLGALTCLDFGMYRGELACTEFCALDRSACEGRCGDDIVDFTNGEQCDTSGPIGSCLSVGYDTGSLACSGCRRSFIGCGTYGWSALPGIETRHFVTHGWFDGNRAIVLTSGENIAYFDNGISYTKLFSTTVAVTGNGTHLVAATEFGVELYANGVWTSIGAPANTGAILGVGIDATSTVVVMSNFDCGAYLYANGVWTTLPDPIQDYCSSAILIRSATDFWIGGSHWNGAEFEQMRLGTLGFQTSDLEAHDGMLLFAGGTYGLLGMPDTSTHPLPAATVVSPVTTYNLAIVGDAVCSFDHAATMACTIDGVTRLSPHPAGVYGAVLDSVGTEAAVTMADGGRS